MRTIPPTHIAGAAGGRIGLAEIREDHGLPTAVRVAQIGHGLELCPVALVLLADGSDVEFQIPRHHLGLEQSSASDALAGDVKALDVTGPAQVAERGADGHAVLGPGPLGEHINAGLDLEFFIGPTQQRLINALDDVHRRIVALDEKLLRARVGKVEEELAMRRLAVTPGATRFLVVGLDTAGHIEVHDKTHIRAVDAHAKGVRRHGHIVPAGDELVLPILALGVVESAVILNGAQAPFAELPADLVHFLPCGAVDDAGFELLDDLLQPLVLFVVVLGVRDVEAEIRALEAPDGDEGIAQAEDAQDIAAHLGRGGGSEGDHLRSAQRIERLPEPEVVGPEIMSPLREAVRLIDGEQADLDLLHRVEKHAAAETLGRDIHELVFATANGVDALRLLGQREGAVDQRGRDATTLQRIYLILHQRDERAHDHGHAFHHHGRKLVAERFPAAGWHDHECVATGEQIGHHRLLPVEELAKAEVFSQRLAGIMDARGGSLGLAHDLTKAAGSPMRA